MKLAFSWDDGSPWDQRLFELHEKYQIPGMFFVPTYNREGREVLNPEIIRNAESEFVQFGGHTQNHVYLTELTIDNAQREALDNKTYLEDILGHPIEHFCLPGGKYNQEIVDMLYQHFKTIRTADTMNFRYEGGLLKPSFHFYPRGIKSLLGNGLRQKSFQELGFVLTRMKTDYFELMREMILHDHDQDQDKVIMIWGHSWEIEKLGMWRELEDLFRFARKELPDNVVAYGEIFEDSL